jgi:hypothetical protein
MNNTLMAAVLKGDGNYKTIGKPGSTLSAQAE